jgi:hypothetical protein
MVNKIWERKNHVASCGQLNLQTTFGYLKLLQDGNGGLGRQRQGWHRDILENMAIVTVSCNGGQQIYSLQAWKLDKVGHESNRSIEN